MIRLGEHRALSADVRFGLSVLGDCSRLVRAQIPDAVELRVRPDDGVPEMLSPEQHLTLRDGGVEISAGALRLVARIAGVVDEQRSAEEDRFGRVPPSVNYMAARDAERQPVVSHFAAELREAVMAAAGGRLVALVAPWPDGHRWAMAMTHDLDVVALWPAFTVMRAAELAGKGRARELLATVGSAVANAFGDPVLAAARNVLEVEQRIGIRSTWFVIAGTPTLETIRAGDVTYRPESTAARRIIDAIVGEGHEVGLHGSFETWTHAQRFAAQRERLERIVEGPVYGVRQHFLRLRPGATHRAMREAGFEYDSSFGFPDRNGFRQGAAEVLEVWDDAAQGVMALDSVPFGWMDRALSKYRGVEDPKVWIEDALWMASACREVEGVWNGIWHPNLSTPLGFPGASEAFEELCLRLMDTSPWSASLGEIVEWRRTRRDAEAVGITPAGDVILRGSDRIVLEDSRGNELRWVPA